MAKALYEEAEVTLFLMADAVNCARKGQKVPEGFYNLELMIQSVVRHGRVLMCGTCMNARGLQDEDTVEGTQRSTIKALAAETIAADKVLVF